MVFVWCSFRLMVFVWCRREFFIPDEDHESKVLVFLIVLYVSSYRWVHFSRILLHQTRTTSRKRWFFFIVLYVSSYWWVRFSSCSILSTSPAVVHSFLQISSPITVVFVQHLLTFTISLFILQSWKHALIHTHTLPLPRVTSSPIIHLV